MRERTGFYLIALIAYLILDFVWLTLSSAPLYRATLGDILLPGFRPAPALAVYLLEVLGLTLFVLPQGRRTGRPGTVLGYGAMFGLFTYGLYDLTNLATLKHWTPALTLIDMGWGAVVNGLAALIGWSLTRRLARPRLFT